MPSPAFSIRSFSDPLLKEIVSDRFELIKQRSDHQRKKPQQQPFKHRKTYPRPSPPEAFRHENERTIKSHSTKPPRTAHEIPTLFARSGKPKPQGRCVEPITFSRSQTFHKDQRECESDLSQPKGRQKRNLPQWELPIPRNGSLHQQGEVRTKGGREKPLDQQSGHRRSGQILCVSRDLFEMFPVDPIPENVPGLLLRARGSRRY